MRVCAILIAGIVAVVPAMGAEAPDKPGSRITDRAPGVRQQVTPSGTITPERGSWGASIRVRGPGFGSADGVRVVWYPNDDDSKSPSMSQSATIHQRHGADEIEIRIPANPTTTGFAGDYASGALRVYVTMSLPKRAVFAGRYMVELPSLRAAEHKVIENPETRRPGEAPRNVTATATGPTAVRIEWQAPAGQPRRYRITRQTGSMTQELPGLGGGATSAIDNTVSPRTAYTYTVVADYGAALSPGTSEPAAVSTPLLLPPTGFTVRRQGGGAARLSWQPRAEAVAYQVSRNGTVFPVTGSSHVDANLPADDHTYTIRTIARLPSGAEVVGEVSNPLTLRLRPFNMVAAGDSVMWGQGLAREQKFTFMVRNWLQGFIANKPVVLDPHVFAHSGAVIAAGNTEQEATARHGEIPAPFPSVRRQLLTIAPTRINPRHVDLILLDGCINDVTIETILLDVLDQYTETLRRKIDTACYGSMRSLLQQAAVLYPNAAIVVTGYFPIASEQSDLGDLAGLLWGFTVAPTAPAASWISQGGLLGGAAWSLSTALLLGVGVAAAKPALVNRSRIFDEQSERQLRMAVSHQESHAAGRIVFAPVPYQAANAYGAPATWLWHIPIPLQIDGVAGPFRKDSVFDSRAAECQRGSEGLNLKCYIASISHPNLAGALAYAQAIRGQLSPFVTRWRLDHSDSVAEPQAALYVRTEYGARSASGGALTVRVANWSTGAPVPGRVVFDGQDAGEIDRPVTYTYRATDPRDISAEIRPAGHAVQRFTIPVRSVAVQVVQQTSLTRGKHVRSMRATVRERETGEARTGTVRVIAGDGRTITGPTGQLLQYAACFTTVVERDPNDKPIEMKEEVDCAATVTVPYYPTVRFADQTGNY